MEGVRNCMAPIIYSPLTTNKWITVCNYFHFIQSGGKKYRAEKAHYFQKDKSETGKNFLNMSP